MSESLFAVLFLACFLAMAMAANWVRERFSRAKQHPMVRLVKETNASLEAAEVRFLDIAGSLLRSAVSLAIWLMVGLLALVVVLALLKWSIEELMR